MHKPIFIFLLILLLALAVAGVLSLARAQDVESLTIQVNGENILLMPGENVSAEIYALALDPQFPGNTDWILVNGLWEPVAKGVEASLEAEQITLLIDHPGLPEGTAWEIADGIEMPVIPPLDGEWIEGLISTEDGRTFEYSLSVPKSWLGKFTVRETGNIVYFDYTEVPDLATPLFSISAISDVQWEAAQQGPGHGLGLLSIRSVVFTYNIALENPYNGDQAAKFEEMSGDVRNIVSRLVVKPHTQASAASTTPDNCLEEVPGTRSFLNELHGYCLLLPVEYSIGQPIPNEIVIFIGSPLDVEHPKAFIAIQDADGRAAGQVADDITSKFPGFDILRYTNLVIDGEAAIVLDGVPGQDLSRQVIFVHHERVYHLTFLPADKSRIEIYNQLKQLYKTVTASFRFLPQ